LRCGTSLGSFISITEILSAEYRLQRSFGAKERRLRMTKGFELKAKG